MTKTRSRTPSGYWYAAANTTLVNAATEATVKFVLADILYDPYGMLGNGTWVFTIPVDGYYSWTFNAGVASNGVMSQYWAAIRSQSGSNGTATYLGINSQNAITGNAWCSVNTIKPFKVGDAIYMALYNGSGTNQNTLNLGNAASTVACSWLAPI